MSDWRTKPHVLEVVEYLREFRLLNPELEAIRRHDTTELSEMGQYILGILVFEPELTGDAWEQMSDPAIAHAAAQCVRGLRQHAMQHK